MTQPRTLGIVARFPFGYFFNTVLFGVQAVARQHHLNVLVIQGTAEDVAATQIARGNVDAWLVMSNGGDANALLPQGKPTVSIGMRTAPLRCSAVLPDNSGGIEAAMQHLAAHGHEQIAFVGWTELGDIQERYEGYQSALAQRGQALDLNRVVFASDTSVEAGKRAVQTLIERGMPCTAIVAATDLNALGIMQALQQAGYNVPGDVAVIGFDDVPLAQSVKPSLSTVRQSFEQLGVAAAQQALAELAAPGEPQIIFTPVQFLPRQSCGCQSSAQIELAEGDSADEQEWQAQLGRALVQTLAHPVPIAPDAAIAERWPEVAALAATVSAALAGTADTDLSALGGLWNSDLALRANIESQQATIALLERAITARYGSDLSEQARALLDRMRLEMMRSYRAYQEGRIRYLEAAVQHTNRISLLLLDESNPQAQQLNWLMNTQIVWGCLGLWQGGNPSSGMLLIDQAYSETPTSRAQAGQRYLAAQFPPLELLPAPQSAADTPTTLLLPLKTNNQDWGYLALAGTLVPAELRLAEGGTDQLIMWATHLATMLERRQLVNELRQSYENERVLASTVRDLGAPIIPLLAGVLLIPLVGAIDTSRAQHVINAVLEGVSQHHASTVLLDLTAVPIVDTQVANTLIQTAQAATLLGAQVILVGIRPEIAQSIVSLGINLQQIITQPSLEVALRSLVRR